EADGQGLAAEAGAVHAEHDRHLPGGLAEGPGDAAPAVEGVEAGLPRHPDTCEDADDRQPGIGAGPDRARHDLGARRGRRPPEPGDRRVVREAGRQPEPGRDGARTAGRDRHAGVDDRDHQVGAGPSTRAALWPPNANDVETAGAGSMVRGLPATTSTGRSVRSWLATGGTTPVVAERSATMASTAPAAPMRWP